MPKKILLSLFIALFVLPVILQVTQASAQIAPLTAPVTNPITNPVTFFNLTGKVTYKRVGVFVRNMNRILPADDVVVRVKGFFDSRKQFSTKTDANGNYQIAVPAGLYSVEVDNEGDAFMVPPFKVVQVKEKRQRKANFQGLMFP